MIRIISSIWKFGNLIILLINIKGKLWTQNKLYNFSQIIKMIRIISSIWKFNNIINKY
jgi:hypothetical protein